MSKKTALMQELRGTGTAELRGRLKNSRDEGFRLRFQQASKQLSSPARVKQVKKDIARILTVLCEREGPSGPDVSGLKGED